MRRFDVLHCAIAVLICEAAGVIGSVFTTPKITTWYGSLAKPASTPPDWVFGPVWTTLFALMGVAAYLVWRQGTRRRDVRIALGCFGVQLVINFLWSAVFFGFERPDLAFVTIIVLWLTIGITTTTFAQVSRRSAWLLLPYIAWVSFAAYLNYAIFVLNP